MKPEELYSNLKQLAEKLDIGISEENLKRSGIRSKSGFCKVKGKGIFFMEKQLKVQRKIDILAEFLGSMPLEDVYLVPVVRTLLNQYSPKRPETSNIASGGGAEPPETEIITTDT